MTRPALILVMLLAAGQAAADDYRFAKHWTTFDTALELANVAMFTVDWMQTAQNISPGGYKEDICRFFLGRHPSKAQVGWWAGSGIVLHALVSLALPPRWRENWQGATLGLEMMNVGNNFSAGMTIRF